MFLPNAHQYDPMVYFFWVSVTVDFGTWDEGCFRGFWYTRRPWLNSVSLRNALQGRGASKAEVVGRGKVDYEEARASGQYMFFLLTK